MYLCAQMEMFAKYHIMGQYAKRLSIWIQLGELTHIEKCNYWHKLNLEWWVAKRPIIGPIIGFYFLFNPYSIIHGFFAQN